MDVAAVDRDGYGPAGDRRPTPVAVCAVGVDDVRTVGTPPTGCGQLEVLVTGATGFVGIRPCRRAAERSPDGSVRC